MYDIYLLTSYKFQSLNIYKTLIAFLDILSYGFVTNASIFFIAPIFYITFLNLCIVYKNVFN